MRLKWSTCGLRSFSQGVDQEGNLLVDFSLLILLAAGFLAAGISFSNHFRRPLLPSFRLAVMHARRQSNQATNPPSFSSWLLHLVRSFWSNAVDQKVWSVDSVFLTDPGPARALTHAHACCWHWDQPWGSEEWKEEKKSPVSITKEHIICLRSKESWKNLWFFLLFSK